MCLEVCVLHGPSHWGGLQSRTQANIISLFTSSQYTPYKQGIYPIRTGSARSLILEKNLQYLMTNPHLHSHLAVGKDWGKAVGFTVQVVNVGVLAGNSVS